MEMDYYKIYNKILTDEEFMEIKQHGSSDYPFQYYYDNLELFDFHCIEWHWHREFEFLYVESGQVTCGIGEKQIILSEGEAIFINSKILVKKKKKISIQDNIHRTDFRKTSIHHP